MARYRLSDPAKADIAALLRTSETMHGIDARVRYRALLTAALRRIAADPRGRLTIDCADLHPGVRSFHIRHSREESREAPVGEPGMWSSTARKNPVWWRSSVCSTIGWTRRAMSEKEVDPGDGQYS